VLSTFVLLVAVTVAVAACGSASGSKEAVAAAKVAHPITVQKARPTGEASNADIGHATAQLSTVRAERRGPSLVPTSVRPAGQVQRARATPGVGQDDNVTTGSGVLNPCTLVSMSEAEAITGGSVRSRVEAPLGPTCVYKLNTRRYITMTIETVNASRTTRQLRKPRSLTIAGHRAYCAKLGAEMLFVPLSNDQLLNITAPCQVAQRLAAKALDRLPA
jgi:hypothetical protein